MRLRYSLFLLLTLGLCAAARAQQPFARFGVKVEVLSLSNGRYPEFFPNDSLRRVGSVVYNRRLHRIAYLLPPDSLLGRAKSEVTSRWWVVDPHAENYVNITPYAYTANNPVNNTDPDGRDIIYRSASNYDKKTGVTTVTVTADVSIKVLNNSQLSQSDFNSRVGEFKTAMTSAFNSAGGYDAPGKSKVHYEFKAGVMDIQAASSMDKVKSTDNLLVMVDEVTGTVPGKGPMTGVAQIGGRIGYVEGSESAETMVHEMGHEMGLRHNFDQGASAVDQQPGNYMSYDKSRSGFSGHQLFQSLQGARNQGGNSSTAVDPTSAKTTTQGHPYREAKTGDKVPRAL